MLLVTIWRLPRLERLLKNTTVEGWNGIMPVDHYETPGEFMQLHHIAS
jgi:hypothetical protein